MRYSVFFKKAEGEKTCVYNTTSPDLMLALMNPKVHLAADSAGTFECSLNPKSPAMSEDILERMATKVMIQEYKDHVPNEYVTESDAEKAEHDANKEKVIFYGRLLSIDKDFYNTPSLYCEGALSFLNDTVIMPYTMPKTNPEGSEAYQQYGKYFTPAQALQKFLAEHNAAVTRGGSEQGIKFDINIANMTVTMKNDLFSGEKNDGSGEEIDNFVVSTYTNTLEVLNNLKKTYGGKFRVRYRAVLPSDKAEFGAQMAIPILDWIADFDNTKQGTELPGAQSYIEFGKNLLDLTQKTDGSNIVNCLFMTGKKIVSAKNDMIGEEIDVAPMAYYWMVKINRVSHDAASDANWDTDYGQYYAVQNGAYVQISSLGLNKPPKTTSNDQSTERGDYIGPYYGAETTPSLVTSDQSQDITGTNVHDLRYFANAKNGGIYRNPVDLTELQTIADTDMSHVYHVGNQWLAWNPNQTTPGYVDISLGNRTKEDDFVNGNVIRVRGGESEVRIDHSWNASSRGMAWIHGCAINAVSGAAQIEYSMGNAHEYSCTGFWDSSQVPAGTPIPDSRDPNMTATEYWNSGRTRDWDYGSLRVYAGEKYILKSWAASDASRTPALSTVYQIITKNYLKTGAGVILDRKTAPTKGDAHDYSTITIPTSENDGQDIILNLSSKDTVSGMQQVRPATRKEMNLQLWRTRTATYDEFITLYGIAQGYPKWYLDSEKYTDATDGKEKSRTVLKIPKRVKQLMMGVSDAEQWFVYDSQVTFVDEHGKPVTDYAEVSYEDYNAFPASGSANTYYIDRSTGNVWIYKNDIWTYLPLAHAYKVNSFGVEDPVSIAKYGRIEKIINYSNCSDPSSLRDLGAKALFEARLEGLELNVTALDLSLLDNNIDSPDVLDMISIRSDPHHVGEPDPSKPQFTLPLTERDIPLNDPAQQQYSIGYAGARKITKTYAWTRR